MTGVSRTPSTLLAISLATSSRSINIHFIPIDKLQAALPRDEVVQAALLGRDRQPIPRHTVDYSPFDGIQIIISMYKFDGAEPGIDEAFRARRHARDAPERDLRDKAPLRCRGLETFIGGAAGA